MRFNMPLSLYLTHRTIRTPNVHVYLNSEYPLQPLRSRRYVAFQVEYYTFMLNHPVHQQLLRSSTLIWEYSRAFLPRWQSNMTTPAVFVRVMHESILSCEPCNCP